MDVLREMTEWSQELRTPSFLDIHAIVYGDKTQQTVYFSDDDLYHYRQFADTICSHITKIEKDCKYNFDFKKVISALEETYRSVMLERTVPQSNTVIGCFLSGAYYYKKDGMPVSCIGPFLTLLKNASPNRQNIIFKNLYEKFDALTRYTVPGYDDDIPF